MGAQEELQDTKMAAATSPGDPGEGFARLARETARKMAEQQGVGENTYAPIAQLQERVDPHQDTSRLP